MFRDLDPIQKAAVGIALCVFAAMGMVQSTPYTTTECEAAGGMLFYSGYVSEVPRAHCLVGGKWLKVEVR